MVKNNWSHTSTPAVLIQGEHSNRLTFLPVLWIVRVSDKCLCVVTSAQSQLTKRKH